MWCCDQSVKSNSWETETWGGTVNDTTTEVTASSWTILQLLSVWTIRGPSEKLVMHSGIWSMHLSAVCFIPEWMHKIIFLTNYSHLQEIRECIQCFMWVTDMKPVHRSQIWTTLKTGAVSWWRSVHQWLCIFPQHGFVNLSFSSSSVAAV